MVAPNEHPLAMLLRQAQRERARLNAQLRDAEAEEQRLSRESNRALVGVALSCLALTMLGWRFGSTPVAVAGLLGVGFAAGAYSTIRIIRRAWERSQ